MTVFLNGQYLPAEEARVSVMDRGFLYGDGVFETLPLVRGHPFLWPAHFQRWQAGAAVLGIEIPLEENALIRIIRELAERNGLQQAVLRLMLTRGPGPRGYSPRDAGPPTVLISLHPPPNPWMPEAGWRVVTASLRSAGPTPLSPYKTCNRLPQILARMEADRVGADEALVLDEQHRLVEASSANVFWVTDGALWSPGPPSGALDGITRRWVIAYSRSRGWPVREATLPAEAVRQAEGLFLTLSTRGVVEVTHWDGRPLRRWPLLPQIRKAYTAALQAGLTDAPA